jgi:hypothetical protein
MVTEDLAFLLRRAVEERALAARSSNESARYAHQQLAKSYARRADRLKAMNASHENGL